MASKNLRVYLYTLITPGGPGDASEGDYLWDLFSNPNFYHPNGVSKVQLFNGQTLRHCELRDVTNDGNVAQGSLALLRDEPPSLRKSDGAEETLPLADGERLLEKNYFLYFKNEKTLVWQFNLQANHVSNMTAMLGMLGGNLRAVTSFYIVKSIPALEPDQVIEYVDVRIAKPRNKTQAEEISQLDPTDWGVDPFRILANTDSNNVEISLQNRSNKGLGSAAKRFAQDLTQLSVTRKLKIKVSGAVEPIDMLAERFTYKISLNYAGSTPTSSEMLNGLRRAKDQYDVDQAASHSG